jgi:hypothetical protein
MPRPRDGGPFHWCRRRAAARRRAVRVRPAERLPGRLPPSLGQFNAISHPVVGDNEYAGGGCATPGARGYFTYFGAAANHPTEPACTVNCKGYYSYDIGSWHMVALNSDCTQPGVGGCGATSPQVQWLKADLAAHPSSCTLAYFSDKGGTVAKVKQLFKALDDGGAHVLLVGHQHIYERFAPMTPHRGPERHDRHPPVHRRHRRDEPDGAGRDAAGQLRGQEHRDLRGPQADAAPDQLRLPVRARGGQDVHRLRQPGLPLTRPTEARGPTGAPSGLWHFPPAGVEGAPARFKEPSAEPALAARTAGRPDVVRRAGPPGA